MLCVLASPKQQIACSPDNNRSRKAEYGNLGRIDMVMLRVLFVIIRAGEARRQERQ